MAEAMLTAVLARKVASPQDIAIAEPLVQRCDYLHRTYGVSVGQRELGMLPGRDLIILSVKPQDLPQVVQELRAELMPSQLVLSVVAGVPIATIRQGMGNHAVARVMPNINARVNRAVSLWAASRDVSPEQKELARTFLGALGKEIYTEEEKYLDMATALSGSGPAYVLLFLEALTDAGVHIGLPRSLAAELAQETVAGSAELMAQTGLHPAQLRSLVVSPGGTTAEGLLRLEETGWRGALIRAVVAAYEKARRLGGETKA